MKKQFYPTREESSTHLFAIGQVVRLRGGYSALTSPKGQIYNVTGKLPALGNLLQYRIRNETERHERVTTEDCLEGVRDNEPVGQALLVSKTFGI